MADSKMLLRVWIGAVAGMALTTTLQCYTRFSFPAENIFLLTPHQVTPLLARTFGTWTALAAVIRLGYALYPTSKGLYSLTFFSFLLAFSYFGAEVFVYKTAPLVFGTVAPTVISGLTALWMTFV